MPSNIAIFLSLLAGYAFVHLFYFTRFRAQRQDGYRLLIECGVVGIILYTGGRTLEPYTPATAAFFRHTFGSNSELIDAVYVVAVGIVSPVALNLAIALWMRGRSFSLTVSTELSVTNAWSELMEPARRIALDWAIKRLGNDLLILLHDAATRPRERQMPIQVTMDGNKVYIGWVARSPNLKLEDEYLSMLPLASGYRDRDTQDMRLNVFYPIHEYADRGGQLDPADFTLVVPYSSIKKVNFFDVGIYVEHFATRLTPEADSPSA